MFVWLCSSLPDSSFSVFFLFIYFFVAYILSLFVIYLNKILQLNKDNIYFIHIHKMKVPHYYSLSVPDQSLTSQ